MAGKAPITSGPDRMSSLIGQLTSGDPTAAREFSMAVHAAIHPLCLDQAGSLHAAYDVEQETWQRLLDHLARRDPRAPAITNGTAYVRQIARDVCSDMVRRVGAEHHRSAGDPDWAEETVPTGPVQGGYRSQRVLHDLAGLSDQEQAVLGLRQTGRSYREIAQILGDDLTAATAQTLGERALRHLRGRVHVEVWSQEPVAGWSMPACPDLARLKTEVRRRLWVGSPVGAALYREIGQHLDPKTACPMCKSERDRSELDYWWLIASIPPVVAGWLTAGPRSAVAARIEDTAERRARHRRARPRRRTVGLMAAAAVLVAAIVVLAIVFVQPSGDQAQPGPADTAKSGAAFARPDPCTLVTLDEMTQASGLPVAACVLTGLSPNRSPVPIKEGTAGRFTTTDPGQFGPPPNLETDDLGADPTSVFAQLCEAIRKGGQDLDSNAIAGLVPGLGDENCYVSTAVASLAVVTLAARRGNVAVIVTLGGNQRRDPPTDLVKLVLSRIR